MQLTADRRLQSTLNLILLQTKSIDLHRGLGGRTGPSHVQESAEIKRFENKILAQQAAPSVHEAMDIFRRLEEDKRDIVIGTMGH